MYEFVYDLEPLASQGIVNCVRCLTLKVSKFQNESINSSHCPKYERKNLKNSVLSIQDKNFQIFRSYFGQCDDFILSF